MNRRMVVRLGGAAGQPRTYMDGMSGTIYQGLPARQAYDHRRIVGDKVSHRLREGKAVIQKRVDHKKIVEKRGKGVDKEISEVMNKFYLTPPAGRIGGKLQRGAGRGHR